MRRRRAISNPLVGRTVEMLISSGLVYLFQPQLQATLAPLQAQLNAIALNKGQTPTSNGLSTVANTLVQLIPAANPTSQTPTVDTGTGPVPVTAVGPLQSPPPAS